MAQETCKFCGETLKTKGPQGRWGEAMRSVVRIHRRVHKAEMAPGLIFQSYNSAREQFQEAQAYLDKRKQLEAFMADENTLDHPIVRAMVADRLAKPDWQDEEQTVAVLEDKVTAAAVEANKRHEVWVNWVRDSNTFSYDELVRLVRIWMGDSFLARDAMSLKRGMELPYPSLMSGRRHTQAGKSGSI